MKNYSLIIASASPPTPAILKLSTELKRGFDVELVASDKIVDAIRAGAGAANPFELILVDQNVSHPQALIRQLQQEAPLSEIIALVSDTSPRSSSTRLVQLVNVKTAQPGHPAFFNTLVMAAKGVRQRRKFRTTLNHINRSITSAVEQKGPGKLLVSDRFLATLVTHADDAMISIHPRGDIASWNAGAERLFDRSEKDVLGCQAETISSGEWAAEFPGILKELIAGGPVIRKELRCRTPRGREVETEAIFAGVHADDGTLIAISATVRDVTARKQTEREIKRQREWLHVTLSSIGDAVIATDIQGNIEFMNSVAETLTGFTHAEVAGLPLKNIFRIINESTRQPIPDSVDKVLCDGRITTLANQTILISKNGAEKQIEDSAAPILDEHGKMIGAVLVFHDISDRRSAEIKLRDSELRLKSIVNNASAIFYLKDVQGRYLLVNKRWEEATGIKSEDIIGKTVYDAYPKEVADELSRIDREVLERKDARQVEERIMQRGIPRLYISEKFPVYDGDGVIYAICGISTDITERRELEQRLLLSEQNSRAAAERANRAKDEFLAVVSHELRTPLTPILGWTRMILADSTNAALVKRGLTTIERNVRAQGRLIEDLLDISRIIVGKLKISLEPADLTASVVEAIDTVRPAAETKGVDLEFIHPPDEVWANIDSSRIQQVIWNLVANAVKFTPKGGRVSIRLEDHPDTCQIEVIDTGVGIPAEYIPGLFQRFSQADGATTRKYGGLGLGLAIVRHLVELHGGQVTAESRGINCGSTFRVVLPKGSAATGGDLKPEYRPSRSLDGLPEMREAKILVIDDETDAREFVSVALDQWGATVASAKSADEGLKTIDVLHPNVIVCDIGMPDKDGFQFITELRARSADRGGKTPAVALTAYARADDRARALASGFEMHIPKPVDPYELAVVISKLLQSHK